MGVRRDQVQIPSHLRLLPPPVILEKPRLTIHEITAEASTATTSIVHQGNANGQEQVCVSHHWMIADNGDGECKYCHATKHFNLTSSRVGWYETSKEEWEERKNKIRSAVVKYWDGKRQGFVEGKMD